ncbi:MAG: hypothetical protein QOI78_4399, partial [Actinomycetota bacterium]|nr:hypothetical protein [Actinomycetota bacterium]
EPPCRLVARLRSEQDAAGEELSRLAPG